MKLINSRCEEADENCSYLQTVHDRAVKLSASVHKSMLADLDGQIIQEYHKLKSETAALQHVELKRFNLPKIGLEKSGKL